MFSFRSVFVPSILAVSVVAQAQAFEPSRNVECIAPADPGGGWDFTCRSVGKVLVDEKFIKGNVQTINMSGGGGGAAFAHTITKSAHDENLLVAASTATTTRLGQNQYPGMNADQVRWVASLGADYGVIAVAKNSPYQNLNDLMAAVRENPRAVKFAGGSAGWDRLKVLMIAKQSHVKDLTKIPYLPYDGGPEALTQVVGGHVTAFTGDLSEAKGFMDSGDIRILAVLSEKRLPAPFDKIPTAVEQGINTVAPNWRGFYVPGKASKDSYQWWVKSIDSLSESSEWQKVMQANGLMPFHKSGAEFTAFVKKQTQEIHDLSKEVGLIR